MRVLRPDICVMFAVMLLMLTAWSELVNSCWKVLVVEVNWAGVTVETSWSIVKPLIVETLNRRVIWEFWELRVLILPTSALRVGVVI